MLEGLIKYSQLSVFKIKNFCVTPATAGVQGLKLLNKKGLYCRVNLF